MDARRGSFFSFAAALLAVSAAALQPATAEVRWRNGAASAPSPMAPADLARTLADLATRSHQSRVVIHLDGPLPLERRAALEASGIRLLSYLGGHAYFARLTSGLDVARAAVLPGLLAVEPIDPSRKLHPDLARGVVHPWSVVPDAGTHRSSATDAPPTVALYVLFHRDFDLEARAEDVLRRHGGTVVSRLETITGVVAHLAADRVADLVGEDDVMYVEPPLPALVAINDSNRARTGADVVNAPPYGLDGSGVTVLVYDAGTVASHADLAGRLTIGQSDTGGVSGHATHVACTVGGDDNDGPFSGMAPAVDIVSYTFEQEGGLSQGFLYTDPGDLEDDYGEAIALYGADVANNSIGTNTAANGFPCEWEGNYGVTDTVIDEIVRGAFGSPFRVVWANGNERGAGTCGTAYKTTAPPACAKNHMTIGALNSNDDSVTSFTSWGPCEDGRLKPDVSGPGCQSGGDGGVTSCSTSGSYTALCGTSMASPTAAGLSALVLEQFRASYPSRPDFRNSLLRALMAQTAVDLGNPGPDYQTGYGSIRVQPAVDAVLAGRFVEDQVTQGEVHTFSLSVPAGSTVKVTLAWDDPAGMPGVGPVLVNDLDLRIVGPGEIVYFPWTLNPANPAAAAIQTVRDGVNNIEQVRILNAPAGDYRVEIEGFDIAEGPIQPFSVATSHPPIYCATLPAFGGVASVVPGDSCGEIDLAWAAAQSTCTPPGEISYNVYRAGVPFFIPLAANRVHQGVGSTSLTDVGLEPGKTYYYVVRAEDSASGEDGNALKKSAAPPASPDIGAPAFAGLQSAAPGPSCGEVLLAWGPALETCSPPVAYDIHRSLVPGFVPGPATLIASTFATGFVDTSVPPGTAHTYLVRARDDLGNQDANDVRVGVTPTAFDLELFATGFEPSNGGWSVVPPNDAVTGNWEWGDPQGTAYQPEDDATAGGVNCWITGLSGTPGNGDVDDGTTTLLSAAYDLSGAVDPTVAYSRWFTNDRGGSPGDPTDTFRVDVSNDDGQSWTPLEVIGAGTPLAWVPTTLALPVAPTSEVRLRFSAADLGAGSLVEGGIDEFRLVDAGQACEQCTAPPAQTLCQIVVTLDGDDVVIDWSANPVGTRAVVYRIPGCEPSGWIKLGTTEGSVFVHEGAALSAEAFNYRVTFVDACGNEQPFCGTTDCP